MTRKSINEAILGLRHDYRTSKATLRYLEAKGFESLPQYEEAKRFVDSVNGMVECFPENQRKIIQLCVLDDVPVNSASYEVGYHYTWALELRDRAMRDIIEVIDRVETGKPILSDIGIKLEGAIKKCC